VCEVTLHLAPCTLQFLLGTLHLAIILPRFFSSFIVPNNYPSIQYILCTQHECMYVSFNLFFYLNHWLILHLLFYDANSFSISFNLSRTNMIISPKNRNLQKIEINHRSIKTASLLSLAQCKSLLPSVNQFVFVHPNCT